MANPKSSEFVTLVSSDGFEFIVPRRAAYVAGTIKKMLDPNSEYCFFCLLWFSGFVSGGRGAPSVCCEGYGNFVEGEGVERLEATILLVGTRIGVGRRQEVAVVHASP